MTKKNILDPGFDLTLRPMRYPEFYKMFEDAQKNTWTVGEVDFSGDMAHLSKMPEAERHLIHRLVAFFATGDSIVGNNLVLNLYKHINSPEARLYLSRQLFEEALHVQLYLTLLDTYLPDHEERARAFTAVENIPSINKKAEFCFKWIESIDQLQELRTQDQRRQFLKNLICFAACIEGLFFFAAFAYVYFLRAKGLLHGLAEGTNWVFRDESCVPEGTEVLTENGFMVIEDVCGTDTKLAQVAPDGVVTFTKSRSWVNKAYSGKLLRFKKAKALDFSVTPDHDVVTWSSTTREYKKTAAAELKLGSTKYFPTAGTAPTGAGVVTAIERFAIAYQADGSLSDRYTGSRSGTLPVVFTLTKQHKIEALHELLQLTGFDYSTKVSPGNGDITDRVAYRVNVPVENKSYLCKSFSWVDLTNVSSGWCCEFVDAVSTWGSHPADGSTCVQYINTSKQAVDTVHAVSTLGGMGSRVYTAEDGRKDSYKDVHSLFITVRDRVQAHKTTVTEEDYEGRVYCPNTPDGTWIMRQNGKTVVTGNCHMEFAFSVVDVIRSEEPDLIDSGFEAEIKQMLHEAIECEAQFSEDVLSRGVIGLTTKDMRQYLQYCADARLSRLGFTKVYLVKNPFPFMDLQDVQELTNFFERRVSAYQSGVTGDVSFGEDF